MCSGPARIPGRNPVGIERTSKKTVLASSASCRKATEAHKGQRTPRRNTFSCAHYAIRSGRAGGCREQPPAKTKDDGRRAAHRASRGGGASASVPVVGVGHGVVMPGFQK